MMAQKDWIEVLEKIQVVEPNLIKDFLGSSEIFLPNDQHHNPFEICAENFSALHLKKEKPGSWIPIYETGHLPNYFHDHNIFPIRAGKAEFFFYKGRLFFDLTGVAFQKVDTSNIPSIDSFVPATLRANFERNENAYLNKAVALGYINHFVDRDNLHILKKEITTKRGRRLLYGQFGKIKTTKPFYFKTSLGSKMIHAGFQFEIDLVLENEDEIIIFEAKKGRVQTKNFSLLQLYYPLIYLDSILDVSKKIRTIFIDITTKGSVEEYRLVELLFKNNQFDRVKSMKACLYRNS
jgi:hypothetical protein